MLERQIMFKQLQELQRQKKLQELNETRQQNVINQLSLMHNVIPARDSSQMFTFGNSNSVHGLSNPNQNQLVHSPVQVFRNGSSQYSHFQDPTGSFEPVYIQESEGLDALDPLEQKILFNTEDTESIENMFEKTDHSSDFPSGQSGSWSALMQSAAAEPVQEEWSGLSFQNPEILTENHHSNMVESAKNQTPWVYNDFPKPEGLKTSNANSSFLGFQRFSDTRFQNPKIDSNNEVEFEFVKGGDFKKGFEASKAATLYNNSCASQYFGLRLALPTQRSVKNYFDPSKISQGPDHSNKPFQAPQSDHNQNYVTNHYNGNRYPAVDPDGQESSRVASSTRQPHAWVDVPPQQNPSGFSGKIYPGNESFLGNPESNAAFGYSLKQANASPRNDSNKNVNYDNNKNIRQVTSDYGDYKPPFWLKNHEASRNEKILSSMYDSGVGNSENLQRKSPNLAGNGRLSSPYLQHLDMANQNMKVLKSKKRKIPLFECLPWHKEVIEGCSRLHDTSTAELEWAYAANRLPEEKDEAKELSDLVHRKRRLILTTQLMQVLFQPASDATQCYDIVTYYASKLALGDACGLASRSHKSHDAPDSSSGKNITSKSSGDRALTITIEGFIDRSKRLEDEFSRLENEGSSFLDVRVEFQDLEKFSVINRFARFHTRGPLVAAESESSDGASAMPKLYPQRYVTAGPMPRTVPEGQNCLLL